MTSGTSSFPPRFYEVRHGADARSELCARFRHIHDALRYVDAHRADGPYTILDPNGEPVVRLSGTPTSTATRRARREAPTIPNLRIVGDEEITGA